MICFCYKCDKPNYALSGVVVLAALNHGFVIDEYGVTGVYLFPLGVVRCFFLILGFWVLAWWALFNLPFTVSFETPTTKPTPNSPIRVPRKT